MQRLPCSIGRKVITTKKCSMNCDTVLFKHDGVFVSQREVASRMLKINVVIIGTWTGLAARVNFIKNGSIICLY